MRAMYCNDCNAFFNEPKVEPTGEAPTMVPYGDRYVSLDDNFTDECPECGSENFEEGYACWSCNEELAEFDDWCIDCKASDIWRAGPEEIAYTRQQAVDCPIEKDRAIYDRICTRLDYLIANAIDTKEFTPCLTLPPQ